MKEMSMKKSISLAAAVWAALAITGCANQDAMVDKAADMAQDAALPFGGPGDTRYAADLWSALVAANLAGPNAVQTHAYTGQHPHGAILQNVDSTLTVNGQTGAVIVKNNYGGEGVSAANVTADPGKYLAAVTVMYKRAGYDPENNDWFWAKYLPDGSLDKNPAGMQLAGRVAKVDPPAGCIGCHTAAPGGDMVFTTDRIK
jgi:hypothetical protein